MKIIDKYLIKNFFVPFAYCIMAFFLLSIVYDLSVNLDTFIAKKVSFKLLVDYYFLSIPVIAVNTMPIATLMAILYELGNLQRFNEIIGFRASGISNRRIIAPFIMSGLLISALSFLISDTFIPGSLYKINLIETEKFKKGDDREKILKVTAFYNVKAKRAWVGKIDPFTNKMSDFEIREFDSSENVVRKITAKELGYQDKRWNFFDGKVFNYSSSINESSEREDFKEKVFDFPETPADLINSQKEADYMNTWELRRHLKIHPKQSKIYVEEKIDLYFKFASPFVSFIVMLIGLAFGLRTTKGGLLIGVGTSIAIFIAYYGLSIVSLAMGKQELIPPLLSAWLPNLFFTAMGLTFLSRTNG